MLVVVVTILSVATSALVLWRTYYRIRTDVPTDPPGQTSRVLASPFAFLTMAVRDDASHAYEYAAQCVGNLGSLDVPLPRAAVNVELVLLILVAATSRLGLTSLQRIAAAIAVLITVLLVSLAQYIIWTPLGAGSIEGIQGRYFLPVALTAATVLSGALPWRWRKDFVVAAVVAVAVNAIAIAALIRHYW